MKKTVYVVFHDCKCVDRDWEFERGILDDLECSHIYIGVAGTKAKARGLLEHCILEHYYDYCESVDLELMAMAYIEYDGCKWYKRPYHIQQVYELPLSTFQIYVDNDQCMEIVHDCYIEKYYYKEYTIEF